MIDNILRKNLYIINKIITQFLEIIARVSIKMRGTLINNVIFIMNDS
jgi:hypothetical protein